MTIVFRLSLIAAPAGALLVLNTAAGAGLGRFFMTRSALENMKF